MSDKKASLDMAIEICRKVEKIAPDSGCHVALTGGCLYKDGNRKDVDILFYRIRQVENIDYGQLFADLIKIGFSEPKGFGWVYKSQIKGIDIDMFFPEEDGGDYYKPEYKNEDENPLDAFFL